MAASGTKEPSATSHQRGVAVRAGDPGGRHEKKRRNVKHDFASSGLIQCGHCGCSMVGEIKKTRYVYYRCTGYRGKCGEPYTREEKLEQRLRRACGNS